MGNPLDLGFTIIEGTYNGLVDRTYNDRVHFSGALNPGMSGGPTVSAEGQVVGVNVATRRGGQLLSFLVPARYAAALLQRVREQKSPPDLRAEVGRQFVAWRSALYGSFAEKGFRSDRARAVFGPRDGRALVQLLGEYQCGRHAEAARQHQFDQLQGRYRPVCRRRPEHGSDPDHHSYVKAIDLNQFQLATLLTQMSQPRLVGGGPFRKWYTPQRCHEDFVGAAAATGRTRRSGLSGARRPIVNSTASTTWP